MFAGAPGAGKTTVALIGAVRMGVPTLYFSADSDEVTVAAKTAAIVSGHDYSHVRQVQAAGLYDETYGEMVGQLPIRWVFDPSEPSLDDISNAITAYVELWGVTPTLIVVDNLMNMASDGGDEWTGMRTTVKSLHWLARKTRACVWLLHHTSEQDQKWVTAAPPRTAIQGKVSQLPPLILTFGHDQDGALWVCIAKNRHGLADPTAKAPLRWVVDFSSMRLWDEPMSVGG